METKTISFRLTEGESKLLEEKARKDNTSSGNFAKTATLKALNFQEENDSQIIDNELTKLLKKELESKNQQIQTLQNLLNQEQSLHLATQKRLLEPDSEKAEKKSFWSRFKK